MLTPKEPPILGETIILALYVVDGHVNYSHSLRLARPNAAIETIGLYGLFISREGAPANDRFRPIAAICVRGILRGMSKFQADREQSNAWREWLARHSTAELRAALDPLGTSSISVGDGGRTLIRQILAERDAQGK